MSTFDKHVNALPQGTRLDGTDKNQYEILGILGVGSFGITYRAKDSLLQSVVAIKEYLPTDFALRSADGSTVVARGSQYQQRFDEGLQGFLEEARTLKRFREQHIVRVESFLQANGTAYMVMEFEEGQSLDAVLKENCPLSEDRLRQIFVPILRGLRAVHGQHFLHRDIKPANIFLRQHGGPVLLDFGAARQALVDLNRSLTGILTIGYAPPEQYSNTRVLTPAADLYALGATMYRCIAGRKPVEATERLVALNNREGDPLEPAVVVGAGRYGSQFLQAIDWCLQPLAHERPQNADALLSVLDDNSGSYSPGARDEVTLIKPDRSWSATVNPDDATLIAHVEPATTVSSSAPVTRRTGRWLLLGLAVLLLGLLLVSPQAYRGWQESRALQQALADYERAHFQESYAQLVPLAEAANPLAQFYLGKMHRFGIGRSADPQQAQKWFDQAVNNGVVEDLQGRANGGNAIAQSDLGVLYFEGIGVEKNLAKAAHWYALAAQQGYATGQNNYAIQLLHGLGVDADPAAAAHWFEKAAGQGSPQAAYALATLYATGNGVEQNFILARQAYEAAAQSGVIAAWGGLAMLYQNGQGVSQNLAQARDYFQKGADEGDGAAQRGLANLYALGEGVEKDHFKALEWYEKAARQGDSVSQNELGYFYGTGDGVPRDYEKSLYWYRMAAEQNNATSQFNLGVMYESGIGVARSLSDAIVWYQKAAHNGHVDARLALQRLIESVQPP